MSINWTEVGLLLNVVDRAKDHPKLAALTNAALAELDVLGAEAKRMNDIASRDRLRADADGAMKHVEEVRTSEAERLAREEEERKKQPPPKTPAELAAEKVAADKVNAAAAADAKLTAAAGVATNSDGSISVTGTYQRVSDWSAANPNFTETGRTTNPDETITANFKRTTVEPSGFDRRGDL